MRHLGTVLYLGASLTEICFYYYSTLSTPQSTRDLLIMSAVTQGSPRTSPKNNATTYSTYSTYLFYLSIPWVPRFETLANLHVEEISH